MNNSGNFTHVCFYYRESDCLICSWKNNKQMDLLRGCSCQESGWTTPQVCIFFVRFDKEKKFFAGGLIYVACGLHSKEHSKSSVFLLVPSAGQTADGLIVSVAAETSLHHQPTVLEFIRTSSNWKKNIHEFFRQDQRRMFGEKWNYKKYRGQEGNKQNNSSQYCPCTTIGTSRFCMSSDKHSFLKTGILLGYMHAVYNCSSHKNSPRGSHLKLSTHLEALICLTVKPVLASLLVEIYEAN